MTSASFIKNFPRRKQKYFEKILSTLQNNLRFNQNRLAKHTLIFHIIFLQFLLKNTEFVSF